MNYDEALSLIDKHKDLYGKPLYDYDIRYMIITSRDKLGEVLNLFAENIRSFDNKAILIEVGILNNEDLDVFLLPPPYIGVGIFSTIDRYLALNKESSTKNKR